MKYTWDECFMLVCVSGCLLITPGFTDITSKWDILMTKWAQNKNQTCSDPVVFGEGDGPGLHVQDAGDGVSLGEGGQCSTQLTPVVQAAAVGTVQPHVRGAAVVIVSDGPARHSDTRSLIPSVLFGDIELGGKDENQVTD